MAPRVGSSTVSVDARPITAVDVVVRCGHTSTTEVDFWRSETLPEVAGETPPDRVQDPIPRLATAGASAASAACPWQCLPEQHELA
jgi:hypothetical protein